MSDIEIIKDTIVVPARPQGFNEVFLGQKVWKNIRLHKDKVKNIKHIAAYVTSPISAITHYARIDRIEPSGEKGRYNIYFEGAPIEITQIPLPKLFGIALQGPRYTNIEKLLFAHDLNAVFN